MKNRSIAQKLWILCAITLLVNLGLAISSIHFIKLLSSSLQDVGKVQLPAVRSMTLADMMHDAIKSSVYSSQVYFEDQGEMQRIKKEFEENKANFYEHLDQMVELSKADEKKLSLLASTRSRVDAYTSASEQIINLTISSKALQTKDRLADFEKLFEELAVEMEALGEQIEKNALAAVNESEKSSESALWITMISTGIGLLAIFLFSFALNRQLIKTLTSIITGLKDETDVVIQTSHFISDVSSKLSEASVEQAASLQQTSSSVDEISAMVMRNSDTASSSARVSEQTTASAQKGKNKIENMLQSINLISDSNEKTLMQMQKSNHEISDIVRVIKEISDKTNVINDIVFQTKLLSFNASVEAARAGEHGKGFAVVAEEVGNLASMSGKAADEISAMIQRSVAQVTSIVDGTKGLMDNLIQQSKKEVDNGKLTARECADALDEILKFVMSVNAMVQEISTASREQSIGVKEVSKAMSELDQVTQSNSSIAQKSSLSANELKDQADRIGGLIMQLNSLLHGQEKSVSAPLDEHTEPFPAQSNVVNLMSDFKKNKKIINK